ncbi:hypothetical protein N7466_007599 [Penicillium verhagenii]|uniref:uncharacterized protein n=1 Tax=Penicillium verhagenii TaxID=1562060 RepID=UPI0025458F6F|nr:uncharacterized protein N7466_007599 [Penicillium verhagenii]KAJ5928643.1 hypothetical protein N7466_007599 [Penicillium verhagenii]
MSYNSGRMPPKASSADSSHPPSNSGIPHASRTPRSHLARPTNSTPRRNRAASFSTAEETRQILAPVQPANRSKRLSLLPRPSTGGLTFLTPSPTPSPQTPILTQPIPSSISSPDIRSPSAFVPSQQVQAPPAKRTRNVLRRKAPLIGKHVENQAQKLSLVIPHQLNEMKDPRLNSTQDAYFAGPSASASSQSSSDKTPKSAVETPPGPAELASLRTINTQNLPPTHPFPPASSPSTRYSESPGMWSRGSTPTSLSSYSPGIMHSSKIGRLRQGSPSHPRLPMFSPSTHASPQSAQSDRREAKVHRTALPQRSLGPSPVASTAPKQISRSVAKTPGPPQSPPPRKSSVKFSPKESPPKDSDIDVEKARKEVEEAELELFRAHKRTFTNPVSPEISVPMTPPRPSRDGTHRLYLNTSPVIQSNLPYLKTTGHKRRESIEKALTAGKPYQTATPSAATSVDSFRPKELSRIPSREVGSPVMTRKSPKLVKDPPKAPTKENAEIKKPVTPKRFGIFHKKSKPDIESNTGEQNRPAVRKGPVAGTGHEGYGKYSQRGRKASGSSSSGVRTRSTSTTRSGPQSVASSKGSMSSRPDLDLDDFLSSRLEPVFISGGGSTLSRTQSELSMSSLSVASSSLYRPTPLTVSTVQSTDSLVTTSTGILDDVKLPSASSLALVSTRSQSPERRSEAADRPQPPKSRMPVPKGKKNEVYGNLEAAQTRTSLSSAASTTLPPQTSKATSSSSGHQQPAAVKESQQVNKKGKSSRWNLFQRNRSEAPKVAAPEPPAVPHTAQLHAAISPALKTRPVAHYALVDADSDELDDIINNIEHSPPTEEEVLAPAVEVPAGLNIRKRHPSILLPSPPKLHGEFEKDGRASPKTAMFNRNLMGLEPESSPEDRRPRRLASVGRIPKVVSRRDRQHTPATQSFSRPFSVVESPPSIPAPTKQDLDGHPRFTDSPWKQQAGIPSSQPPDWGYNYTQGLSPPATIAALNFLSGPYSAQEFIHFSPNKSSPSASSPETLAAVTAVIPRPEAAPMEDEIWKEYDDLIDHVLSPEEPKTKSSDKPEDEERFQLATMASRALQDGLNNPNSLSPGLPTYGQASVRSSSDSIRLRRSRIVSALHSSISPSTQPSYSNLIASYGDGEESRSPANSAQSQPGEVREKQSTFLQSLATAPTPERKSRDGRRSFPGSSERDWDVVTSTNMKSASLMTSRWLSFGRVLFSPAHNHVKTGTHGRILVIDGLGNDDWSFYCSLTYPNAEVYSLSGRPVSTALPHPAAWQPPTNHHTVYHAGLQNPLPFPKDYFAVTVLRFPTASPEAMQSNIIQECKRVLRSGGYLEMILLDRDMVNMGPRTRKAVRRLKEMTCLANPAISLKPSSDNVQRLLGTQGFDNLRRCMVRIPVAGRIVRSSDSTTSSSNKSFLATATTATSSSATGFSLPAISVTTTTGSQKSTQTTSKVSPSDDTSVSLGDLLSDPSPSAANDESIAKIVARVGRWWYTKCYEDPVLPASGDNDPSMWRDRKVLRECQQRGTGFRMLIAYAQKPSEVKRRTASV